MQCGPWHGGDDSGQRAARWDREGWEKRRGSHHESISAALGVGGGSVTGRSRGGGTASFTFVPGEVWRQWRWMGGLTSDSMWCSEGRDARGHVFVRWNVRQRVGIALSHRVAVRGTCKQRQRHGELDLIGHNFVGRWRHRFLCDEAIAAGRLGISGRMAVARGRGWWSRSRRVAGTRSLLLGANVSPNFWTARPNLGLQLL